MRLNAKRIVLLAAILAIGWVWSGRANAQGDPSGMLVRSAISVLTACACLICYIVTDYREREDRHEKEAEERLRKEIESLGKKGD